MAIPLIAWAARLGGGLLLKAAPGLINAIVRALGIAVITYVGVDVAIDAAQAKVVSNLQGLPAFAAAIAGLLKLDVAVQILFAAVAGRLTLSMMSGTVRKFKF